MKFLPIVERELRVAARRRGTYWNRMMAALLAVAICAFFSIEALQITPRELGQILFTTLAGLFGILSLLAGIRYTADCLSEEKREGTLGLLFLTDLRGYDVVLGKLAATSLNAFYGLLAIFPVLAIPLLMGGVSLAQFGRMTLVLVNALFFSLAAGLLVSALSRNARKAMSGTLGLIALFTLGLPALGALLANRLHDATLAKLLLLPSSGFAFLQAHDLINPGRHAAFWTSLATIHLLAWAVLLGAGVAARRTWQDRPEGDRTWRWRQRWQRLVFGTDAATRAFRTEMLAINPCLWLGARHRLRPLLIWGLLGFIALLWLAGWLKWGHQWLEVEIAVMTAFLAHITLKLALASEAAQRLGPERRAGTLELVLATPLSVCEILRGQMLVLRHQFLRPVLAVLLADACFVVLGFQHPSGGSSGPGWGWFCFVGITTFVADLYTLAWVGLWTGLTARHANRAASDAVARVLILPWLIWVGISAGSELWRPPRPPPSETSFLTLWFVICLATNAVFLAWCRMRLHRDLRALATARYEPSGAAGWARWRASQVQGATG
jgi:ABC-type transport system involved in multi-copper enzyme maturation permease subunit